jgi:SAM-dependent methyltransferase
MSEKPMDFDAIQRYWEQRAASDRSAQSTTNDVYLRAIEHSVVDEAVVNLEPKRVLDVGCGDARTTAQLAAQHRALSFTGFDYSDSMIANARAVVALLGLTNLSLRVADATKDLGDQDVDFIYTTRCLINVPTWELQQVALDRILAALSPGGHYLMIENFLEGHRLFNELRQKFDLPEISIRNHNCFFERDRLVSAIDGRFSLVSEQNISSSYYVATRIVYSRICKDTGVEPDYFDAHHKYAAMLPFFGEYGPVRALLLKKI